MVDSIKIVAEALPFLVKGGAVSVGVVLLALSIGFILGVPLAVIHVYGRPVSQKIVSLYVWFFRGVPILVLLFLFYFGLAFQFSLDITPFTASCIVLGLTSAAYQSQIFRGGINAIAQGQLKAALALGMNRLTGIRCIIVPQALRLSIPGWTNEYSILLKDSALVSVLGTMELMARTKAIATSTTEYAAFYMSAALLYFLITLLGVGILRVLEKHVRIPGYTPL